MIVALASMMCIRINIKDLLIPYYWDNVATPHGHPSITSLLHFSCTEEGVVLKFRKTCGGIVLIDKHVCARMHVCVCVCVCVWPNGCKQNECLCRRSTYHIFIYSQ